MIYELCLSLKVTTDKPPFELYYVELFDRYRKVRTAIRKYIELFGGSDGEYKQDLIKLDSKLNLVLQDKKLKNLVAELKYYHHYFRRLCSIFDEEGRSREKREYVEKRVRRYRTEIKRLSATHSRFKKVVKQLDEHWDGLFHAYEFGYIPRTNNEMEKLIWNFRKIWKRITGYNNVNNWISHHGPFAIYLLNFKRENGKSPLQTMGIEIGSLTLLMGSVSPEIRKKNFEKQKALREDNKIRNTISLRGIKAFLKDKVEKMKEILKIRRE